MKKKILYAFYHGSAFGWILAHRLTVHKNDDAYLMVSSHPNYHSYGYVMREYLKRFMDAGIFQGMYTHDPTWGLEGHEFDTLEKTEKEIHSNMTKNLKEQNCKLEEFDEIYNHTDGVDAVGIYLAMRKMAFSWFEVARDASLFHINRGYFTGKWYSERKGYQAAIFKYKTILGEYENEKVILLPQSNKSIDYFKNKHSNVELFDQEKAIDSLTAECKDKILKIFGLLQLQLPKKSALILLQSTAEVWLRLTNYNSLARQYSIHDYYCLHIQNAIDYFVPSGYVPVLKQHPSVSIDNQLAKGWFGKAFSTPNLFSGVLMRLLKGTYDPPVLLEAKSSFNGTVDGSYRLQFPGVLCFPIFYHKYFISLVLLNMMKCLAQDAGLYVSPLKLERERQGNYFGKMLVADIRSLVRRHFPKALEHCDCKYVIHQEKYFFNNINKECEENDFVFYLDVWHEITKDEVKNICDKYSTAIIKIEKTLLKQKDDVIDSLEDDYIFVASKDQEKVKTIKDVVMIKNNPTIGVRVLCHGITLQQYLLDKQQAENKEQMTARVENDKKVIEEIAASIRKVEDVITSNRVK